MSDVTRILNSAQSGDPKAAEELLPLIYTELRRIAGAKMANQPPGHTLQPTALVHEAYLKLVGGQRDQWNNSRHFFASASEAMRHILIDRARRKLSQRRHHKPVGKPVHEMEIAAPAKDETVLEVNEALEVLGKSSPELVEIVRLRFFAGFNEKEIASILDSSERTVQRQWAYARARLAEIIEKQQGPAGTGSDGRAGPAPM
jgi:RNA polymerase sigma factor (TIGR02999 family)